MEEVVKIEFSQECKSRLKLLHFREPRNNNAGNFLPNLHRADLVAEFREDIERIVESLIAAGKKKTFIQLNAGRPIGWSSTIKSSARDPLKVEKYQKNKRCELIRYKLFMGPVAPLTQFISFAIRYRKKNGKVIITIEDMQPGPCIGRLVGDVCSKQGVIFFHPQQVGEDLEEI